MKNAFQLSKDNICAGIKSLFNEYLHLLVLFLLLINYVLVNSELYRLFLYINLIYVIKYFVKDCNMGQILNKRLLLILLILPFYFYILNIVATLDFKVVKQLWHLILAVALAVGVGIQGRYFYRYNKCIPKFTLGLVGIFVLVNAYAFWVLNRPYGTTKNPHYIAIFSAIMLLISGYGINYFKTKYSYILVPSTLILGFFILHSMSRPTWIGLCLSGVVLFFLLKKKQRLQLLISTTFFIAVIAYTGLGGVRDRAVDLIENLKTEERVVIWQDTWKMQKDSQLKDWVVGHGINAFEKDFPNYSRYSINQKINFNSPHNFLLELLYNSGLIGLITVTLLLITLVMHLLSKICNNHSQVKSVYILLLLIMITNFVMVSITLPFFTSYNLNILAIVFGVIMYLDKSLCKI